MTAKEKYEAITLELAELRPILSKLKSKGSFTAYQCALEEKITSLESALEGLYKAELAEKLNY